MDRKSFIKTGIVGSLGLGALPVYGFGENQTEPEPIKTELVKEFVLAGHFNLDKVKNMLNDYPNLIYSSYDWGNGDFEEAIEGAGHKGNKEVANYLIEQGARVNLFVLTMLGKTNLVKPMLEAYPNLIFSKGPHGLTLLHHAEVGGEQSKELYNYLMEKGLTQKSMKLR
ncbi:ankyrin repeat domain-containing protein [Flagellimonas nanhaiensis]|uniref:Ankyrin repeat domain-containing protein n=1 Tax=Flagellimonas nanhaiensis TaxID=2292706 RepID=A0A371JSW5_9FLAO|nr:ankyrin repeat domain-containing protein [Allomuricauda nanhaiensis]RDY60887.1 ankyrin repeat domain-containing protein [Allomuricauda nanhaiensis]